MDRRIHPAWPGSDVSGKAGGRVVEMAGDGEAYSLGDKISRPRPLRARVRIYVTPDARLASAIHYTTGVQRIALALRPFQFDGRNIPPLN